MIEIKGYTNQDLQFIIDNYATYTVQELSNMLNKSYNSISNAVRKLGLIKQKHNKWTQKEINFLTQNYKTMTSKEMTKYVDHSVDAINSKRDELNLIRDCAWEQHETEFLKDNYLTMTHAEIAKSINRTETAVRAKCFDLQLFKKELPWSESETQFVKDNYMEMPTVELASQLNRSVNAVKLHAQRMGYKKYPYTCDYHYFDTIDTEEKAYWLGFLTADGWISKNEKTNSGAVGIELQYGDIDHLKKFNKSINGNYQITDRWKQCPISTSDTSKKNHMCCIRIFSITMYNTLLQYGFSKDKSYQCSIPKLSDDLLRHYIRGYFDGDGRFGLSNSRLWVGFCTASKLFNDELVKILTDNKIEIKEYTTVSKYDVITYIPEIVSMKYKLKFLDWIYENANIYLDRKYKKYLKSKTTFGTHTLASLIRNN